MKNLADFIAEGMARLSLTSENQLAKALGYKSSGFISQARQGKKGLPQEREDLWITILCIPPHEHAAFRSAAAASRANQKDDVREDYAALEARLARLVAAIRPVVTALEHKKQPSAKALKLLHEALTSR